MVLTVENRNRDTGPSAEVHSLSAKYDLKTLMKQFGDRAQQAKPADSDDKVLRKKRDAPADDEAAAKMKVRKVHNAHAKTVLTADVDLIYRPQTRETRAAYEVLLQIVQAELGDKPHDVLRSAADEVLSILKDERLKQREKQRELEALFRRQGALNEDQYAKFVNVAKKITDYKSDADSAANDNGEGPAKDDDMGVPGAG